METYQTLSEQPEGAEPLPLWACAPYAALVSDAGGTVRHANDAARALMRGLAPGVALSAVAPGWLQEAHREVTRSGDAPAPLPSHRGQVGSRIVEAHPTRRVDGSVVWWLADDTERQRMAETLRAERARTAFLDEASEQLLSSLNLERCMEITAQLCARHLADAAAVVAPSRGHRLPVTSCGGESAKRAVVQADPAVVPGLKEALQGFPHLPSRWIDPGCVPQWLLPEDFTGTVGAVTITPLPGHGVPAGALVLVRASGREGFSEEEEAFVRVFAARAGAALSAARLYAEQASITTTLMRELLPPRLHEVHGVEFAGRYRAARDDQRVGGDFYEVHPAASSREESLVVLGDVCGKGLDAAVLTGKIRNTLHALVPLADDHRRVLTLLNDALIDSAHTRFATLVLGSVLREERSVRVRLTSAGHPAPIVVRADGRVERVEAEGTLIGVLPDVRWSTRTVRLGPSDTCVLFTDGITEARGGPLGDDQYGEERLERALADCAGLPAEAVVERVHMLAGEWVGSGRHDDMAVVAMTPARSPLLRAVARTDSGGAAA